MAYYIAAWKNYTNFHGRATRKEYWMYFLLNLLFAFLFYIFDIVLAFAVLGFEGTILAINQMGGFTTGLSFFYMSYLLIVIIPSWAILVRRLHDIGKSGWMQLVSLIPVVGGIWLLVLLCTKSESGENKYDQPKTNQITDLHFVKLALIFSLSTLVMTYIYSFFLTVKSVNTLIYILTLPNLLIETAISVFILLTLIHMDKTKPCRKIFLVVFILHCIDFFVGGALSAILILSNFEGLGLSISKIISIVQFAKIVCLYLTLICGLKDRTRRSISDSGKASNLVFISAGLTIIQIVLVPLLRGLLEDSTNIVIFILGVAAIVVLIMVKMTVSDHESVSNDGLL